MKPIVPFLAFTLLGTIGCGSTTPEPDMGPEAVEPCVLGTIQPVHEFAGIYIAGQPSPDDFQLAAAEGMRTIVNIRLPKELGDFDEEGTVQDLGMTYIALPWNGVDALTDEVFDKGRELFETAERPMMMHCGSANRIGAMWIPWRVLDHGIPLEDAIQEAKTVGLRTDAYLDRAREYIATR